MRSVTGGYGLTLLLLLFTPAVQAQAQQPEAEEEVVVEEELAGAGEAEAIVNDEEGVADEEEEVTTGEAFLLKLKQGGATMLFLLLASIILVASALERFIRQRKSKIAPRGLAAKADQLWVQGNLEELQKQALASDSTLGRMLVAVAAYRASGFDRVSTLAGDVAARDLRRHMQRCYPLAVVATISPLLGLFGTVIGMIGAFDQIAVMGELANPAAFGGDIGKALITTGAGLAIAIPALALYHWFKSRIGLYSVELEEQVSVLIAKWFAATADDSAALSNGSPAPASKETAHAN